MPLKPFQANYWMFSDTTVPPLRLTQGGYPGWQATVVASTFGALWELACAYVARWRWAWRLVQRVRGLPRDREGVLLRALDLVEHPDWDAATRAVQETAKTLGFNRPEMWKPYSHALKADPGRAENVFRHIRACELTRQYANSTMTNPTVNALVELAYQGYALKGR